MKQKTQKFFALLFALLLALTVGLFAACDPGEDEPGKDDPVIETPPDDPDEDEITALYLVSSKTEYLRNDVLDVSALSVTAQYSGGDFKNIPVSEGKVTLSAGDNETLTLTVSGEVTVTFTYGELSDSVTVNVSASAQVKFEAEDAAFTDGLKSVSVIEEVEGHMCAGNLTQNIGAAVTFNLWAESAGPAELTICIGTPYNREFSSLFRTEVNGELYSTEATVSGSNWTNFVDVGLGEIELDAGLNTVSFVVYDNGDNGRSGNIDYIKLVCGQTVGWASEEQLAIGRLSVGDITLKGENASQEISAVFTGENSYDIAYTFEGNNIKIEDGVVTGLVEGTTTQVTAKTEYHEVTFTVTVERTYGTLTVADMMLAAGESAQIEAAFSEEEYSSPITYTPQEEGIVSVSDGTVTALKSGTVTVKAQTQYHETTFEVTVYDPAYYQSFRFEAENGAFVAGTRGDPNTETYGTGTTVGNLNSNVGGGVTLTVYAEEACLAKLGVSIGTPYGVPFTQLFDVIVNGEKYDTSAVCGGKGWTSFQTVSLGQVRLNKGANTVSLLVNSENSSRAGNLDFIELDTYRTLAPSADALAMGRLVIADITLNEANASAEIAPVFTNPDYASEPIEYTFEGNNIKIEGGTVTGLIENTTTAVTAASEHFTAVFNVTVKAKYGMLTIADVELSGTEGAGSSADLAPVFSGEAFDVTYTFEGNNIKIEDGVVTGLVEGTTTRVTATTDHHEVVFTVTVGYTYGTLTIGDITLSAGETATIAPQFSKEEYASAIEYILGEEGIVSIENGVVTALKNGTVTVTAKTEHHEAEFEITVETKTQAYRFEAEDAKLSSGTKTESAGTGTVVGGLSGDAAVGRNIEFTVYAEQGGSAVLTVSVATPYPQIFTNLFTVTVNGMEYTTEAVVTGSGNWTKYAEVVLGEIALNEGANTVTITLNALDGAHGGNIDYIELNSATALGSAAFGGSEA